MAVLIKDRRIAENSSPPDLVLEATDDPALVAAALAEARVVAVRFPKFGDGRAYSIARLLRERYGYKGELRAIGEVGRDLLYYMQQCGFDAFELRAGEDPCEALTAFDDFTTSYQSTTAEPLPLFRRRPGLLRIA